MTRLESFFNTFDYKLTEAGKFGWTCWPNAWHYAADSEHGHISGIVNPLADIIYEVIVSNHKTGFSYRWLNPEFVGQFKSECLQRRIGFSEAGEGATYADTESLDDILAKAFAIYNGLKFDERLVINLDMSSADLLRLALAAHEQQVSLNDFIIQVVKDAAVERV
jgi:hypothetical protein